MDPYAKSSARVLRLVGEYELNVSVYDWDTGFATDLAGTLQTELGDQVSDGVQELVWTWAFVVIALRDIAFLRSVAEKLNVNASIRKFIWNGVYRQETPLSLALSASWAEAVEFLISAGAKTEDVVSFTDSRGRIEHHDLLPQITKLGVHLGGDRTK